MITEASILGASILVVDDQAASVNLLERTLEGAGYTNVSSTLEPSQVFELHRLHAYDLIILDLLMPEMDGFAVMEGLKPLETGSYLPVLAVTASRGQQVRALQSGAKDYICKPFELTELLMRVHNLLEVRLFHAADRAHVRELELLARRDPLTGLANRRAADEHIALALAHARRHRAAMAVIYLDLDGFKAVNDAHGHGVGDLLLQSVAQRLKAGVRGEDTVARLGGDEFMVVLLHVNGEADASRVAAKLIEAVGSPHLLEGREVRITASAGISLHPAAGDDAQTLMKNADHALYEAKQKGRNAVRAFSA